MAGTAAGPPTNRGCAGRFREFVDLLALLGAASPHNRGRSTSGLQRKEKKANRISKAHTHTLALAVQDSIKPYVSRTNTVCGKQCLQD